MNSLPNPFEQLSQQLTDLQEEVKEVQVLLRNLDKSPVMTDWLNVQQAAALLGISHNTLYNQLDRYPHSKLGGRLRFRRDVLERMLEEDQQQRTHLLQDKARRTESYPEPLDHAHD